MFSDIFKGRGFPSLPLLKSLRVTGGATAIMNKLIAETNYDNTRVVASGVITTDLAGVIKDTHWVLMGALRRATWAASKIWKDADKDVHVIFRFPDLSVFEFPATSNMSAWVNHDQLDVRFLKKSAKEAIDWETAAEMGVGDMVIRAIIVPGSVHEASVWVVAAPISKETLASKVSLAEVNSVGIPYISIPMTEMEEGGPNTFSAGKAVTATMVRQETNEGVGMGLLPFSPSST